MKERCGSVSFKKGEEFYRKGKVTIQYRDEKKCEAMVSGVEDFEVVLHAMAEEDFEAYCSCPKLASVKNDCQHVAAVLHTLLKEEKSSTLSEEVFHLFARGAPATGHQKHFEHRTLMELSFQLQIAQPNSLLTLTLSLNGKQVRDIRELLFAISTGTPYEQFDATTQCFKQVENEVVQELVSIVLQEGQTTNEEKHALVIPPFAFSSLVRLLHKVDDATINNIPLKISEQHLDLRFHFERKTAKGYVLKVDGLRKMTVFPSYHAALTDTELVLFSADDTKRLAELKRMIDHSKTSEIPIPEEQAILFMEKVIPGLRSLGTVTLDPSVTSRFSKTPLVAKFYIDRVKDRLLASLEFKYDQIVINPLDQRAESVMVMREREKENQILDLLEESKFAKSEQGFYLHNEELEYHFLYHVFPKLEKFVHVYATTAIRNRIFREASKPSISVRVKKERTNWLEFKFEMDGIKDIEIRELLAALEEKKRYFRMRNGTLFSLETREFEEIQRFLKEAPIQQEDLEQGLNMPIVDGFRFIDTFGGEAVFNLEDSFIEFLEQIKHPDPERYPVPESLKDVLRDYQKQGYQWLKTLATYGFGGILADDMGLGKTIQSIAYIKSELEMIRHLQSPVLIVCPSSLTYNWLSEIKKFTPEIVAGVVDGSRNEREAVLKRWRDVDVLITSYPALRRDSSSYSAKVFHTVFFDEAQAFKNPLTQTARTVKRLEADHKFALTGTPVENALEELWSIYHVVFPQLFMGHREYSFLQKKTIARRIRPFMLRRVKEDVLSELPQKQESMETVELLPEQKKLYAAYLAKLRHDTLKHLNKDTLRKNKIRILAGITRLRQICCHPTLFVNEYNGKSAKFELLLELVEEAQRSGRRVLIFSQFTKMLELIGKELMYQGLPYFYLDGQTPSMERVELCERFNAGENNFFLISLKAGGTGLNLTGADTVILYDLWWNPAVEEQAADRAHRMGQKNKVEVIRLVTRGTVEEKMNELQEKKRHLIEEIMNPDERIASSLTEEDIRDILSI